MGERRGPPFDQELVAGLNSLGDRVPPPLTIDQIQVRRERGRAERPSVEELRRGGMLAVEERLVPEPPAAPDLPVLICRPTGMARPTAVVYWVHGGGIVLGNNREGADEFLGWAQAFGTVVVSPEYRLAPETPHPGPIEDCCGGRTRRVLHPFAGGSWQSAPTGGRAETGRRHCRRAAA